MPCPMSCAAAPVSLSVSGSVLPKYAGKPRSWSSPMPRETAASNRFVPDSFEACEMKAVLHELATAVRSGMSPSALRGVVAVVLELLAVHRDRGGARHDRVGRQPGPQQRQAAHGLERRPGRGLAERREVLAAGAGTVGGGEDLAGAGPDGHQRAGRADAGQQLLGLGLEAEVEREHERVAGRRLGAVELARVALLGHRVDRDAGRAAELLVVPRLEAGEPGQVAGVVLRVLRDDLRGDLADPAEQRGREVARSVPSGRSAATIRPPGISVMPLLTAAGSSSWRNTIASTNAWSPAALTAFT